MTTTRTEVRRGLPREPGGEPWPVVEGPSDAVAPSSPQHLETRQELRPIRQGLPRETGGEPWPPPGTVMVSVMVATSAESAAFAPTVDSPPLATSLDATAAKPEVDVTNTRSVTTSVSRSTERAAAGLSRQRISAIVVGVGLLAVAGGAIVGARWLLDAPEWQAFFARYPGGYDLPDSAPVGIPAWLGWQHFFNVFLLVLIVRSGLRVRTQGRPAALWASKRAPERKISIELWVHSVLDILWVANGLVFYVLLFTTGQWMRIVPTSWDVFPNAISAAVQYASLVWPTENSWVHYNSLQQLAYFTTVFVAAPLAIVSGARLSAAWSSRFDVVGKVVPLGFARAVHFPVMLYFVAFTAVHVLLVMATGALRNLNHMYAAQDSDGPIGLITFAVSLIAIAIAWFIVRPSVVVILAKRVGVVSSR